MAGGARPVVAADIGYGDNALSGQQLTDAGMYTRSRSRAAPSRTTATPSRRPGPTAASASRPSLPTPPRRATLRQLALAAAGQVLAVTWRQGTKTSTDNPGAAMASWFLAVRVRPAGLPIPRRADRSLPGLGVARRGRPEADEPCGYWLSTLPKDTPLEELVRLAKIRWRVEHDYRELKTGLGLDHFEGRSFTGWHRHVTLAVLAQAFCTMIRTDPKAPAPG